jgi:putative transposase
MKICYQYRLRPTRQQSDKLYNLLKIACDLYNTALEERKSAWEQRREVISYYDQARSLRDRRNKDDNLKKLNYSACQQVLLRLDRAFNRFLRGDVNRKRSGFPRFKKPTRFRTLVFIYGDGAKIHPDRAGRECIRIQNVGLVRVVWHRKLIEGIIKQVWISLKPDGWYVTFAINVPDEVVRNILPETGKSVGIDVGIENIAVLSDGSFIENPRWFQHSEQRIAVKQRILSRKVKGSKRWRRLKKRIAKDHQKLARQRRDFFFKLADQIVRRYSIICVEKLNIKELTQGNFSKQITDAGWGVFLTGILPYKAWRAGRVVITVPGSYTSQICFWCGCLVPKSLGDREHICPECGFHVHRDLNSALVIKKLGLEQARGNESNSLCPQEAVCFS